MPKSTTRASTLLASVTEDILGGFSQQLHDHTIRVEDLMLEIVRPDPVQPRRVLPERIHLAFHESRLTPTQALRELVQIAQVAARQRGKPFTEVLDLVTVADTEDDGDSEKTLSPEEKLLRDLVYLAVTIRDDGQVNPLTVVDMTQGVTRLYRIETGERRYWATWLLRDFLPNNGFGGTIPCLLVPAHKASVFRQAKENTARAGLSAIAMARQAALLLLTAHGFDIPPYAVPNAFYRQALDLDLRSKREFTDMILNAMGGISRSQFSRIKAILNLSDEALELADRHQLDEGVLRYVLMLESENHTEMVQQIISLKLTIKQVKEICEASDATGATESTSLQPSKLAQQLVRVMRFRKQFSPSDVVQALISQEGDVHMAKAKIQKMQELLSTIEHLLHEV